MAKKQEPNGLTQLKQDLNHHALKSLYVFYGEETYLREYYLSECRKEILDGDPFAEFNLFELDGKSMTPELLRDAVESYPAMAERKLVIVNDFDLYKPPAAFTDLLQSMLQDLPEYVCLIFYYDVLEFKQDKRVKMHTLLSKHAQFVHFEHLEERQLIDWVRRRFHAYNCAIDDETIRYFIFLCGTSMTNLITEIEKAAAFSTTGQIKQYHIDAVCTRVLDAVIFDLSDAITERRFDRAIALVNDLLAQKNTETAIFSTISRHIQRLYAAKLGQQARAGEKTLMSLLGSSSPYFLKRITTAARRLPESWLRECILLCDETDAALKSSAADKQKILELTLLNMAAKLEAYA